MKGLKKQRRIQVIAVAAVALAVSTALIGYALQDGINFFRSPTEVTEAPPKDTETFRIGGLVEEGSLRITTSQETTFNVTDGNAIVPVTYTGILPDLFEEGQGMVGTGRYIQGVFQASEILAKHDEKYMPVEVIDALKAQGVYQEADGS
jgi:cytochrome c-type biogenesis protein CcmE